jgi:hypothetical protein
MNLNKLYYKKDLISKFILNYYTIYFFLNIKKMTGETPVLLITVFYTLSAIKIEWKTGRPDD